MLSIAATAIVVSTAAAQAVSDPSAWHQVNAVLDKLISIMNSPFFAWLMTTGIGALGGGKWLKNQAVQKWATLAFHTVEEMARTNPGNEKLDKAALFTETFQAYMKRAGWLGMVTEADIQQAHAIAKSVNVVYSEGKKAVEGVQEMAKK